MAKNTRSYDSLKFRKGMEEYEVTGRALRRLRGREKELNKYTYYSVLKK